MIKNVELKCKSCGTPAHIKPISSDNMLCKDCEEKQKKLPAKEIPKHLIW